MLTVSRADTPTTSERYQHAFPGCSRDFKETVDLIMSGKRSASEVATDEPDSKVAKLEPTDGAGAAAEDGANKAAENPAPAEEENKKEVQEGGVDGGERAEGDSQGEGEEADAAVCSILETRTRCPAHVLSTARRDGLAPCVTHRVATDGNGFWKEILYK